LLKIILGSVCKIVFKPHKKKLSKKNIKNFSKKLRDLHFDDEAVDLGIAVAEKFLSGDLDLNSKLKMIADYELAYEVAKYCAATAIDDEVWSAHEKQSFEEICGLLEIPKNERISLMENAWISHFEITQKIKGWGTGFFINNNGTFLTNQHVASRENAVYVRCGNKILNAKVLYEDKDVDFAIARIPLSNTPYLALEENLVQLADKCAIYGYPDPELNGYSINRTSGTVGSITGFHDDKTRFRIDAVIHDGNSGGPVVSEETRKVIGIATEGAEDVNNCALKVSEIISVIEEFVVLQKLSFDNFKIEDAVVQLFAGPPLYRGVNNAFDGWTHEKMCKEYKNAIPSEKWEIFSACLEMGWNNPY